MRFGNSAQWETITNVWGESDMNERQKIYDELCALITDYEWHGLGVPVGAEDLYAMLVKIQNNWECVITAQDE